MTTTDQAYAAAGLLIAGIPGFSFDDEVVLTKFVEQLRDGTDDGDALNDVCREMSRTWTGKLRPSMHQILTAYHEHPAVREQREERAVAARLAAPATPWCGGTGWIPDTGGEPGWLRPCPRCNPKLDEVFRNPDNWEKYLDGTELEHLVEVPKDWTRPPACKLDTRHDDDPRQRTVSWAEGQALMNDAYREATGRNIGDKAIGDPGRAEAAIRDHGHQNRDGGWECSFVKVLNVFGGDQRLTRASLDALGGRLTDDDYGRTLVLGEPPQPLQHLSGGRTPRPAAPVPPETADGPTEPVTAEERSMADALAETARLLGERP